MTLSFGRKKVHVFEFLLKRVHELQKQIMNFLNIHELKKFTYSKEVHKFGKKFVASNIHEYVKTKHEFEKCS
jgi:hypothetical protein